MKKTKTFDAVKVMRDARDKLSQEMINMTPDQRVEYIRLKAEKARKELKK